MKTARLCFVTCFVVGTVTGLVLGWSWIARIDCRDKALCSNNLEAIQCAIDEAVDKQMLSGTALDDHADTLIRQIVLKCHPSTLCCPCGGVYALQMARSNFVVVACSYHHGWNIGIGPVLDTPGAVSLVSSARQESKRLKTGERTIDDAKITSVDHMCSVRGGYCDRPANGHTAQAVSHHTKPNCLL